MDALFEALGGLSDGSWVDAAFRGSPLVAGLLYLVLFLMGRPGRRRLEQALLDSSRRADRAESLAEAALVAAERARLEAQPAPAPLVLDEPRVERRERSPALEALLEALSGDQVRHDEQARALAAPGVTVTFDEKGEALDFVSDGKSLLALLPESEWEEASCRAEARRREVVERDRKAANLDAAARISAARRPRGADAWAGWLAQSQPGREALPPGRGK